MKTIETEADVYEHFDAKDAKGLERSLYKYTSCGAWGKVQKEGVYQTRKSQWTGKYSRCQDEWCLQGIFDSTGKFVAPVPPEVQLYFWPGGDGMQQELEAVLGSGMEASYTAEIEWREKTGEHTVFIVGSIVEGVDEEAETRHVYLPCTGKDLDDAVEAVEKDCEFIWNNTHGCEECSKRNGWDWPGCAVDEECPSCEGSGISI